VRAALGVLAVAESGMERAMRVLTLERGRDPRALTLVPFGGAAGLHACALADALRLPRVLVPRDPGVVSALGLLLADATVDRSRTALLAAREATPARLRRLFRPLENEVRAELGAAGHRRFRLRRRLDLRYRGQSHELTIDAGPDPARAFAAAHRAAYGFDLPDRPVELVTLRVRGVAPAPRTSLARAPRGARAPRPLFVRPVHLGPRAERVPFFRREELPAGPRLEGPAILLEETSTTLVAPGFRARHDDAGNLVLERRR
jgi:N-methylhydantoinase A